MDGSPGDPDLAGDAQDRCPCILHQAVQNDIAAWLTDDMGWHVIGITESSIKGPEGNREFIIVARKP